MPSDAKKKRDLAKKQAAKTKGGKPKSVENGDDQGQETPQTNGHSMTNGNGETNGAGDTNGDIDDVVKREGI